MPPNLVNFDPETAENGWRVGPLPKFSHWATLPALSHGRYYNRQQANFGTCYVWPRYCDFGAVIQLRCMQQKGLRPAASDCNTPYWSVSHYIVPVKKSAPAMRPFVKIFCSLVTSTFVLRASCYVFCNARISNSTDFTKAIPATMVITIKKDVTLLARHAVLPWSYNQTGCGMTSSPGLRRWSRLQARRGVRDKRQRALLIWSSYVHD